METKVNAGADTCHGCRILFYDDRREGLCPICSHAIKNIPFALSRFVELIQHIQPFDGTYVM